jgi:hypothetical protein
MASAELRWRRLVQLAVTLAARRAAALPAPVARQFPTCVTSSISPTTPPRTITCRRVPQPVAGELPVNGGPVTDSAFARKRNGDLVLTDGLDEDDGVIDRDDGVAA